MLADIITYDTGEIILKADKKNVFLSIFLDITSGKARKRERTNSLLDRF